MRPAKTQISLGIRPVWSESSLSAWRKLGSLATQWAHSKDSDQTRQMPRLIRVFAGCTVTLLVLSCCSLYIEVYEASDKEPHLWSFWVAVHACLKDFKLCHTKIPFLMRRLECNFIQMCFVTRKPFFRMCDQVRLKPATQPQKLGRGLKFWIQKLGILFRQRTTKALISLRGCAGWSVPLLFAYGKKQIFSWCGKNKTNKCTLYERCGCISADELMIYNFKILAKVLQWNYNYICSYDPEISFH